MLKYNILATMEDKAGFIANNLELEYEGIDFDGVILFTIWMDKTLYSVRDYTGYSAFFELYYEAENYLTDLTEGLQLSKDDFNSNETLTMRLTKNHISFRDTIRGDDIDSCRLENLFNDNVFNDDEFIKKVVFCDGNVRETCCRNERGE